MQKNQLNIIKNLRIFYEKHHAIITFDTVKIYILLIKKFALCNLR